MEKVAADNGDVRSMMVVRTCSISDDNDDDDDDPAAASQQ